MPSHPIHSAVKHLWLINRFNLRNCMLLTSIFSSCRRSTMTTASYTFPSSLQASPAKALVPPGQCQFGESFTAVPLLERTKVSPTSSVLRFGLPVTDQPLNLSTCACILANANIDGNDVTRPYTPISTNQQTGSFDLLVKDYGPEHGTMSHYLCSRIAVGDQVSFKHIAFNVKTQAPFQYDQICMLVGGTGTSWWCIVCFIVPDALIQLILPFSFLCRHYTIHSSTPCHSRRRVVPNTSCHYAVRQQICQWYSWWRTIAQMGYGISGSLWIGWYFVGWTCRYGMEGLAGSRDSRARRKILSVAVVRFQLSGMDLWTAAHVQCIDGASWRQGCHWGSVGDHGIQSFSGLQILRDAFEWKLKHNYLNTNQYRTCVNLYSSVFMISLLF